MKIESTKDNKTISVGSRMFRTIDAANFKAFGYSCIIVEGNVLRASDACVLPSSRERKKRILAANKRR